MNEINALLFLNSVVALTECCFGFRIVLEFVTGLSNI